jgi:hypothetical protein
MLATSTSQSVHGLRTKETTKVEWGPDDESGGRQSFRPNAVSGNQRLLCNGYEEKPAESMNLGKLYLGKATCPAPAGGAASARLFGFGATWSFIFLLPATAAGSIRQMPPRRPRAALPTVDRGLSGGASNSAVLGDSATGSARPAARHTSSMRQRTALASRGKLLRGRLQ